MTTGSAFSQFRGPVPRPTPKGVWDWEGLLVHESHGTPVGQLGQTTSVEKGGARSFEVNFKRQTTSVDGVDAELWMAAHKGYLARRQRLAAIRADLAAARTVGLERRHAKKVQQRDRSGVTPTERRTTWDSESDTGP